MLKYVNIVLCKVSQSYLKQSIQLLYGDYPFRHVLSEAKSLEPV
jgi:hypothetical protein